MIPGNIPIRAIQQEAGTDGLPDAGMAIVIEVIQSCPHIGVALCWCSLKKLAGYVATHVGPF